MTDVYYISGPMTGLPEHNFPAFNAAAAYYRERGFEVINPAEMDDQTEPGWDEKPWSYYLRRDLAALVKATHVVLLPGWERSKGARLEIHVAKELGMSFVPHFPADEPEPEPEWRPDLTHFPCGADCVDKNGTRWDGEGPDGFGWGTYGPFRLATKEETP